MCNAYVELVRLAQRGAAGRGQNGAGIGAGLTFPGHAAAQLPPCVMPPTIHSAAYQRAGEKHADPNLRGAGQRAAAHQADTQRNVGFVNATLRHPDAIAKLAPSAISPTVNLAVRHQGASGQ